MNLRHRMEKFNKRWDIQTSPNYAEEFNKFKIRILNIFKNIDDHVSDKSIRIFCNYYGIIEKRNGNIINKLHEEDEEKEFYRLLEIIFSLDIGMSMGYMGETLYSKEILFPQTQEAISFSNVNLSVGRDKNREVIFYPKGEEVLDEELVNQALRSLDEKSSRHFVDALKFYQEKNYIKSAESLRRTIEEFLKVKFNNSKGLAANRLEVGEKLKNKSSDAQIRKIVSQIFGYLDQYFNDNSKHNDGEIDEADNEFLIYQTGLLIRYLNKVL